MEDDAANLEAVLDPQGEEEVQHEEATEDAEGEEAPQEEGEPEAGDEGTYKYNIYMICRFYLFTFPRMLEEAL